MAIWPSRLVVSDAASVLGPGPTPFFDSVLMIPHGVFTLTGRTSVISEFCKTAIAVRRQNQNWTCWGSNPGAPAC